MRSSSTVSIDSLLMAAVMVFLSHPATGSPPTPPCGGPPGGCVQMGPCDVPSTRDATPIDPLYIRVIVHVMYGNDSDGVPQEEVDSMIAEVNTDFSRNMTGIRFVRLATRYHENDSLDCIGSGNQQKPGIAAMKALYAELPVEVCNMYVSCVGPGFVRARGFAVHPWDPAALDTLGGVWLRDDTVGAGTGVATHELGHALGLHHTHHGVDDSAWVCGDPCYEYASGCEGDIRGDFASDTPPTPANDTCDPPPGADCRGTPWGPTQPENFMGIGGCRTLFTPQQVLRMQCWTKDALSSWLVEPGAVDPVVPPSAMNVTLRSNPAGREIVATFSLPKAGEATLELLDIAGRSVSRRNFTGLSAGHHVATLDEGRRLAAGVYVIRLTQESAAVSRKVVILH